MCFSTAVPESPGVTKIGNAIPFSVFFVRLSVSQGSKRLLGCDFRRMCQKGWNQYSDLGVNGQIIVRLL